MPHPARATPAPESAVAAAWFAGPRPPLRLEDGRPLKVIFPGIPGAGPGPDARDAILDAGGDYLKGDVEFHLAASGWRAHGHHRDPAYGRVVLHVVAHNDTATPTTIHAGARSIPVLVLPPAPAAQFPPPFTPPCAYEAAAGRDLDTPFAALSRRRLRSKAAHVSHRIDAAGPPQALYSLLLETIGGPANRAAFAALAAELPLPALLERAVAAPRNVPRHLAIAAELRPHLSTASLHTAGIRPAARPARRLEATAHLLAQLWPAGVEPAWPASLAPDARLPNALRVPGIGRALAIELCVNAVLPAALVSSAWPAAAVEAHWAALPSPGTYGKLRPLERWLTTGGERPFRTAATLQAGLLLHADYCSKGACGRCPLSS